jgi:hypothetical protein
MNKEVGTFRKYRGMKVSDDTMATMMQARAITMEYETQGIPLSLRQLYYQFVSKNLIANNQNSYNRLGNVVSDGRMIGLISWTAIEDRGRNLQGLEHFTSPQHAIRSTLSQYRVDKWANQPMRPEVWVEKEALVGVIGIICNKMEVDFFACKGYNSQSEAWRAGRRFARYVQKGQRPIVFHLGDHDPSGLDMTRDNKERLELFAGVPIPVMRLALNMDQIEEHSPPPNYAKVTDSRFSDYQREYGDESWELDALSPKLIQDLIRKAVLNVRDQSKWDEAVSMETEDKRIMEDMIEQIDPQGD